MKIVWNNKDGLVPKTIRENQVWDDDMNEIKQVVNTNDEESVKASGGVATICEINGALIEKVGGNDKTQVEIGDKCIYKRFSGVSEIKFGGTYTNATLDGDTENINNWVFNEIITTG